jgi:hypothetical protein
MSEPDPLAELARLRDLKGDVDKLIIKAVRTARRQGTSWYKIGPALGVTRQAASERFGPLVGS